MRKLLFISITLLCYTISVKAQQLPQYSQYMLNNFAMNPAIAGTRPFFQACSDNRYQWVGIPDAPRTYMLTIDGPITDKHIGIGTYLYTDITGPTRRTGFSAAYSYHMKLANDVNVSLGLSTGILQFAIDGSQIVLDQPGDQALTNQLESVIVPDFGAGLYVYGEHYYFGAAAPQLIQSEVKLTTIASAQDELATHLYVTGGYDFTLGEKFMLDPCIVVKYVYPATPQLDISARLLFLKKMWLGLGYRTGDAAYAMVGYTYQDNLTFGYSYDYSVTTIQTYSYGTNEIFIGIKFNRSAAKKESKAKM